MNLLLLEANISGTIDNSISFGGTGTNYTISWEEVGYPQHNGVLSVTSNSTIFTTISFGTSLNPNPIQATYKVKASNGNGIFYGFKATHLWFRWKSGTLRSEPMGRYPLASAIRSRIFELSKP
jgi:hypothetical protein